MQSVFFGTEWDCVLRWWRGEMMRKVILYIAMTIDGKIADANDGISFLEPYDGIGWIQKSYEDLLHQTDSLLMGRRTYEVIRSMGVEWPYPNHACYVYSQTLSEAFHASCIQEDVCTHVRSLLAQEGKDIWLVGGGMLVSSLIEENLIDTMIITVIPIVLGEGIPLFTNPSRIHHFRLSDVQSGSGLTMLTYEKTMHEPVI